MSFTTTAAPARAPGPPLRMSLVVMGLGIALGIAGGVGAGVTTFSGILRDPAVPLPASLHRHLDAGTYDVFQRTGTRRGGSPFSTSVLTPTTLTPPDVQVRSVDGTLVQAEAPYRVETLTRGSATYTAAVRFRVPSAGDYVIDIRPDGGIPEVVVSRSVVDTFRDAVGWFVALGIGVLTATLGLVLLLVGVVRRNRAQRMAPVFAMTVPPGWYPDPGGSGRSRWWDGARWTDSLG